MNLLILIHRLPFPADRGAKLRAALELRWLAERHNVWCAGLWEADDAGSSQGQMCYDEMKQLCRGLAVAPLTRWRAGLRAARAVLAGSSASEGYFSSVLLEKQVLDWAREVRFDAVLAFSSSMAPLALRVPARRRILDLVDLDSTKWRECAASGRWIGRPLYRIEAQRLAMGEREWIAAFDASVVVNHREADQLARPLRDRVHVIETGHLTSTTIADDVSELPQAPIVGFVGAMDYEPNVDAARWFADEIWPRIRERHSGASWWIVGRSPTRAVRRLAKLPGVTVTGAVPRVEPYIDRMRVHVAPLRIARGVQTKVVAAMARGRPSVVTSCVAEGIDAERGKDYLVVDSPSEFAESVLKLFADRDQAEHMGRNARAFVLRRFDAQAGLRRLEDLLIGEQSCREEWCQTSGVRCQPLTSETLNLKPAFCEGDL